MTIKDFESAKEYLGKFVSYEETLQMPYDVKSFDLKRVRDFLREWEVDYERLMCVHVAGSKGKGSTCRMIADYLWRAGYKVGLYTSPHMKEVTERFWLNGKDIGRERFVEYVEDLRKFIDVRYGRISCCLTYFEILTVIALKFFVDCRVDYAILEVGLGGRLDATNIVKPVLSVITSVEFEHVGILGNNLNEIIDEKLGIVKESVPVLVGYQQSEALKLIREKLLKKKGVFYLQNLMKDHDIFDLAQSCNNEAKLKNAGVAFAALKLVLSNVDLKIFQKVVKRFNLPGRFDVRNVSGRTVVFDMAHTKSSIENLINGLRDNFFSNQFVFLVAIMKGKDAQEILKQIDKVAGKIVFTNAHERRGILAKDLQKMAQNIDLQSSIEVVESCTEAYKNLLIDIKKSQVLVVTGSHFLVGKLVP